MPKRILYWFRNDLRLHDNEGFARAVEMADEVLPVYVFEPRWFDELSELGFRRTGIYRAKFMIEAVADLRRSLQAKGADLIIRVGHSAKILAQLAEEIDAEAIYASKEVAEEETDTESDLSKLLKPINIDIDLFWVSTLYHVRDLPFWVSRLPKSFTEFHNSVEPYTAVRKPIAEPQTVRLVPGIPTQELPSLASFGFSDVDEAYQINENTTSRYAGGETTGVQRLHQYIWENELVKTYEDARNGLPSDDYPSKFSAWLALGCLSPRLIYQEVIRYQADRARNDSTERILSDLIWRDFFRFTALRYGSRLFKPSGIQQNLNKPWLRDKTLFEQWAEGKTGIPFIDANMRELNATGFMSNRGRQTVSRFLANDLGVIWTWGASYFESLLVDYDPCTNWGSWNYVADVSNDPHENRTINVYDQAVRFDEAGEYVKRWLPELAAVPAEKIHSVYNLSVADQAQYGVTLGDTYPLPIINPNRWATAEKNR
ncbi:DASH family cryptochrome [Spirosoma sp. RP8]|uniref:Cryptochrome DASH n=1 Tax=Spirosoma liriopis TaxID=2937440 RepID=A0ABT0HKB7_9BACT|nr:DASH family cryptochrome [Spirosoma liriopis]MCK8492322.1 DASH family cryptochrome [Spirosoma liriopis]